MKYIPPLNGDQGDANRPYIDANPAHGIEGSIPSANAIEHPMREIVSAIEYAGLTPDGADLTQLHKAIVSIVEAKQVSVEPATIEKRGIARVATKAEVDAGVTSGTVPAFVTPETLAMLEKARIYSIGLPFNGDPLKVSLNHSYCDGRAIILSNYPELQAEILAGRITILDVYDPTRKGVFAYTDATKTAVFVPYLIGQFGRWGTADQFGENHLDAMQKIVAKWIARGQYGYGFFNSASGAGYVIRDTTVMFALGTSNTSYGTPALDTSRNTRTNEADETVPPHIYTYPVVYLGKTKEEMAVA